MKPFIGSAGRLVMERLPAALCVLVLFSAAPTGQAPGDLVSVLGRVSDRVQRYYGRASNA
jgi:hypothetical protein